MRLAYQGEPGAYSEAAALLYGGADVETLPCKSFDDVFEAVEKKRATHGVVPLENSIGGTIHRNYDLLLEHDLPITGEVELDVVHCLQALPGTKISDITVVYSHPQALAQCERYLKGLGVTVEAIYDTAGGAKLVAEHAVIGLARSIMKECGPLGIRVNVVAPGPVETRMMRPLEEGLAALMGTDAAGFQAALSTAIPLARYAEAEEIAGTVAFLMSDEVPYMHGEVITVGGGLYP